MKHGLKACAIDCGHRSAEKSWQRSDEDKFKELKDNQFTASSARIVKTEDAYGLDKVPPWTEKYDYTYKHVRKARVVL